MGSATREALAAVGGVLDGIEDADLATAEELFGAARVIAGSGNLLAALGEPSAAGERKTALMRRVLGGNLGPSAERLLTSLVSARWSHQRDLAAAIEDTGIRVAAASAPEGVSVVNELFGFARAVDTEPELELALGSKLGVGRAKAELVRRLLQGRASEQTVAIVVQLVLQPAGRSLRPALQHAQQVVADQAGHAIATVRSATPPTADRLERISTALGERYGKPITLNVEVDPALLGGLRIRIGHEVIDGSIATRMEDVRARLAG